MIFNLLALALITAAQGEIFCLWNSQSTMTCEITVLETITENKFLMNNIEIHHRAGRFILINISHLPLKTRETHFYRNKIYSMIIKVEAQNYQTKGLHFTSQKTSWKYQKSFIEVFLTPLMNNSPIRSQGNLWKEIFLKKRVKIMIFLNVSVNRIKQRNVTIAGFLHWDCLMFLKPFWSGFPSQNIYHRLEKFKWIKSYCRKLPKITIIMK